MPWSINGREIFSGLNDGFPLETEEVLDWAEEQESIPEYVLLDLREHMPRRTWQDAGALMDEVQNYTWTTPEGAKEPVWGGVTQTGLD